MIRFTIKHEAVSMGLPTGWKGVQSALLLTGALNHSQF